MGTKPFQRDIFKRRHPATFVKPLSNKTKEFKQIPAVMKFSSKDPTNSSKDPTNRTKDPTNSTKDPTNSSKDPTNSSKDPTNSSKDPTNSTKDPTNSSKIPTNSSREETSSKFLNKLFRRRNNLAPSPEKPSGEISNLVLNRFKTRTLNQWFYYKLVYPEVKFKWKCYISIVIYVHIYLYELVACAFIELLDKLVILKIRKLGHFMRTKPWAFYIPYFMQLFY